MIRYPEFRERGWQIGSGPTESQCKLCTKRLKGYGRRWDRPNATAVAALDTLDQKRPMASSLAKRPLRHDLTPPRTLGTHLHGWALTSGGGSAIMGFFCRVRACTRPPKRQRPSVRAFHAPYI